MQSNIVSLPLPGSATPIPVTNKEPETIAILVDGDTLRLYKRNDLVKRNGWDATPWQCEYRAFDPASKERPRFSTKTADLELAKRRAADGDAGVGIVGYRKLKFNHSHGIASNVPTFEKAMDAFLLKLDHEVGKGNVKQSLRDILADRLRDHILPFFAPFETLVPMPRDFKEQFFAWRRSAYAAYEKDCTARGIKPSYPAPSGETHRRDMGIIRRVYKNALSMGFITAAQMPDFDEDHKRNKERRAAFTEKQLDDVLFPVLRLRLMPHSPDEAASFGFKGERYFAPGTIPHHQRRLLWAYCMFLNETGMRPGEAMSLRIGDIEDDGKKIILSVLGPYDENGKRAGGKTGRRPCAGNAKLRPAIAEVLAHHPDRRNPDAPLWLKSDRTPVQDFGSQFSGEQGLLPRLGMTVDQAGDTLSLYSFRHSFITRALRAGIDVHKVAKQCGTSPQQIKDHYDHVTSEEYADEFMALRA